MSYYNRFIMFAPILGLSCPRVTCYVMIYFLYSHMFELHVHPIEMFAQEVTCVIMTQGLLHSHLSKDC